MVRATRRWIKTHRKHYSKAIFSERNAFTKATIELIWENAPLEALGTGVYSEQPTGVDEKSVEDERARAIHIPLSFHLF